MQHQKRVIRELLKFLAKTLKVDYKILEYPDEIERKLPACDALAVVGSRKVALEHTSIDSVPFQRRDNSRFIKLLGPLEEKLTGKLPVPGHYRLDIHMNVIPTGIRWANVRQQICEWCLNVGPALEIVSPFTSPRHSVKEMPQGVPFEVTLFRWPRRDGQFKIGRFSPEDLEDQRIKVIYQALVSRGAKVSRYRNNGFRTILVLESNDIALANSSLIGQAFVRTINEFETMLLPDEVYLVETVVEPYNVYPLKFGDALFPNVIIAKEPYLR